MSKVIYTCITGKYDTLKEPQVITEGWDYICFTDTDLDYKGDTWKIIKIGKTKDVIRHQRKKKIYNEWIFESYDESIWVDGSMVINCDLEEFTRKCYKYGHEFVLMNHPTRNCIYQEAKACMMLSKDSELTIMNQIGEYKKEGLPEGAGMVATGVLIRKHSDEVKEFCKAWYAEIEKHSIRDQLSFNYVNWKTPVEHALIPFGILQNQFILCPHSR